MRASFLVGRFEVFRIASCERAERNTRGRRCQDEVGRVLEGSTRRRKRLANRLRRARRVIHAPPVPSRTTAEPDSRGGGARSRKAAAMKSTMIKQPRTLGANQSHHA